MKIKNYSDDKKHNLNKENVNMYVCGPTVYNSVHIGNVRSILVMDVFSSALKANGTNVNLMHNITDIDDKIIAKAKEESVSEKEITEKYTSEYMELLKNINVTNITSTPKVTENIDGMVKWVQEAIDKGAAYEENGSVYFRVDLIEEYGQDFKVTKEELLSDGEHHEKEHSHDFALWKNTDEGVTFDSPWSQGRPGWHTECAFFIAEGFDRQTIDIHGGGIDLRFPHHTNEDAQYRAIVGKKLSDVYSYVGHLSMSGEKMSKSLGNIVLAKDFVKEYNANVLRYSLLSTHYSKPINFNDDFIQNSVKEVSRIENTLAKGIINLLENGEVLTKEMNNKYEEIKEALLDDIDTAKAFTLINEMMKDINTGVDVNVNMNTIVSSLNLLGFEYNVNFTKEMADEYKESKENKDFEKADNIRERATRLKV